MSTPENKAQEWAIYKKVFDKYDVDKNGHITAQELSNVLKEVGDPKSSEQVAELVKELDTSKNGTIEFEEFASYLSKKRSAEFRFDTSGDGFITPEEVIALYKKWGCSLTEEQGKAEVARMDANKDGKVSYIETIEKLQNVVFQ